MKTETINVAHCVLRSTQIKRTHNGKGRPSTYVDGADAIATSAKHLAELVLAEAGIEVVTGIFIEAHGETWQHDTCVCCNRPVRQHCPEFLIDRETLQVLPPDENSDKGNFWPIGPSCIDRYPGVRKYERQSRKNT